MNKKPEILSELQSLGIEIPMVKGDFNSNEVNNYLSGFNSDLKTAIFLDSLPKEMVYKLPANYFNDFKVNLPEAKTVSIFKYAKWAAAAGIILFIALGNLIPTKTITMSANTAQVSEAAALEYIETNIVEFTEEDLQTQPMANIKEVITTPNLDELPTEDLNEYLLENNLNDI